MSVAKVVDEGYKVLFEPKVAKILNDKNEILQTAERRGNLYFVQSANLAEVSPQSSLMQWHTRLGHLNERSLKEMLLKDKAYGLEFDPNESISLCEICIKGKQIQSPFPKREEERTTELLEIVHTDICGPMRVKSKGGSKYFITFIDDKSRWCEIHFLKKKNEALAAFKQYKAYAENFTGKIAIKTSKISSHKMEFGAD